MIVVLIVPTGVGAEIGGHAGDATPVARMLGAISDKVILHPNVVNASDINEMPANALYVEGSMLDRFLGGEIELEEVKSNRILVAANAPVSNHIVNCVSGARVTLGVDAEIVELKTPLRLVARRRSDCTAGGEVHGWHELVEQVKAYQFDALAISTAVEVPEPMALEYLRHGGVNPWGGVEAMCSRLISWELERPVAHAPCGGDGSTIEEFEEIVDPRMGAEIVSVSYLFCVLKGLHRAPRIGPGLSVGDVDLMISPYGCVGPPHQACRIQGIPVIVVKENRTVLSDACPGAIVVENYLEAAGIVGAMRAGIRWQSVRRPLEGTKVHKHG